jgi:deoxycytidine triphosphate deaminase
MGLLSGQLIKNRLIQVPADEARAKCEASKFDELGGGIGIYPFEEGSLGGMSYDLRVGEEAFSLRRGSKQRVSADSPLRIEPGESVIILTQEFVILSTKHAALCVSKARIMNEGVSQSSAKVDPTWFGKLMVPVTNNTKGILTLRYREPFCTLLFFELDQPVGREGYLNRREIPFLGQESLEYEPRHSAVWRPLAPEKVREQELDEAVSLFGPPFDTVRGVVHQGLQKVIKYMEEQWSPGALRDLKYALWQAEIDDLKRGRDEELRLIKGIFVSMILAVFLAVVGWIAAVVLLFARAR